MSEPTDDQPPRDPGLYSRPSDDGPLTGTEIIAGVLTLAWLALTGGIYILGDGDVGGAGRLDAVLTLVAVFLPVAMIWIGALTARTARTMRDEARRLQAAIDAMRHSYLTHAQSGMTRPSVEKKLEEIVAAQKQTESALATFTSRRDAVQPAPQPAPRSSAKAASPVVLRQPVEEQPALELGTPTGAPQVPIAATDFIRALNFPDSQDDREGFRALRRVLEDRNAAKLVRAAQDVLTLLSQEGIYMDDLTPDRARPEIWRRFAQGERGRGIAALGGVRDRSSLALTAARMRQDTVFRDAAHHFLRQFDKTLAAFEPDATDAEIADLAATRTARAFMLLGRVTGTFD